ncbi:MAG: septum formation initiator family protein [Acutalibacteraceae bacterium]
MEKNSVSKNNSDVVKNSPDLKEVKVQKQKKKNFWLLYLVIFGFAVYSVITLVNQSIAIEAKKAELQKIRDEIVIEEIKNDEMSEVNNFSEEQKAEYIEEEARDIYGYIKPDERVFIIVSGD